MTTREEFERAEEEARKTIAALLKAGCSPPLHLQKKYDAHMRDVRESVVGRNYIIDKVKD